MTDGKPARDVVYGDVIDDVGTHSRVLTSLWVEVSWSVRGSVLSNVRDSVEARTPRVRDGISGAIHNERR